MVLAERDSAKKENKMEEKLTHTELLKILAYDSLTGILKWKINIPGVAKIGDIAGSKNNNNGYIQIGIKRKQYLAHRLACFYYYGYMPENGIDHRDQVRHHNWILNLRETSQQCNLRNVGNSKRNTSGVKGISICSRTKKWIAQIHVNYKTKFLGYYDNFDDAVCARLAGEQCVNWEGCDSSSPAYKYVKENIL